MSDSSAQQFSYGFGTLFLVSAFLLAGCDNSTSVEKPKSQITDALILLDGSDDGATIEVGETVKFTGYALTESGGQIPLAELGENWDWEWESTNPAVFTVDTQGNATGVEEGEAFCVISLNGQDDGTGSQASKHGGLSETAGKTRLPGVSLIFVGRNSVFVNVSAGF